MGRVVDPKCRSCGHEWEGEILGGLRSAGYYRCDRCGSIQAVRFDDLSRAGLANDRSLWDLTRRQAKRVLGTCSCGGAFDKNAPVRCPECSSDDVDLDRGPWIMAD